MIGEPTASSDALSLLFSQQELVSEVTSRLEAAEHHVRELLSPLVPTSEARATIRTDACGLVTAVTLERSAGASPDAVKAAFADAAAASRLASPALPIDAADELLKLAAIGESGPTVTIADDPRQFSVSAQYGSIIAVDGMPIWLARAPVTVIADEVLRIGRQAALASDSFNRFSRNVGDSRG